MIEFTGERVIPGQVNDDLWAEHVARYAFAARFASGMRVLDAGCGAGYGTAEMARHACSATGIDNAPDAVRYASEHASLPNLRYVQASATALPFTSASFDLVTAFEVIEHLENWKGLLEEARRVLTPSGWLLVSTPNRLYYAESRALDGPNPYHVHEFEHQEFQDALKQFFPYVQILLQNRLESFAFHAQSLAPAEVRIDAAPDSPANAHFFLGLCSGQPLPDVTPFVFVPRAANVLREREQHIRKLEKELAQTKLWLDQLISDHKTLQDIHQDLTAHLDKQNRWAQELEGNWKSAQQRVAQLQDELQAEQAASEKMAAGYAKKVADLEEENRQKTAWAIDTETRLTADLAARAEQLADTVRRLDAAEATVIERTEWAQRLDAQLQQLHAQLDLIRQSRWIRLGRTFRVGPNLDKE